MGSRLQHTVKYALQKKKGVGTRSHMREEEKKKEDKEKREEKEKKGEQTNL